MIIKRVSINNKEQHAPSPIVYSTSRSETIRHDRAITRSLERDLSHSECRSSVVGEEERWMLNVIGRKWRPRSAPSLCITRWFTARSTSRKRANARIYGLPRGSRVVFRDALSLLLTCTSLAHLRDLHKSRKHEGGAKSKVQHHRSRRY